MTSAGGDQKGAHPTLSAAEMTRVAQLLYRWTGMIFGENKRYYIERRIGERMRQRGQTAASAYLDFASGHIEEREMLINAFTINETYFYREAHQLAALSNEILPEIIKTKRPGDLVRIWSMPCSTGEEPYSIAIWLLENWSLVDAYNIEIVGSDIDTAALAQARAGYYSARSLARLPEAVLQTYFEPERNHRRKIIDDLRESVHLLPANLVDRSTLSSLDTFDVILCRNLLIYFDDEARLLAANNLFDATNIGGYVCLGHSESMNRISDRFALSRLQDAIVYRRL